MKNSKFKTALIAGAIAGLTLSLAGTASAQRHDDEHRGEQRHEEEHRGAGPEHNFYVGHRLPPAYHQSHYVVDDWRGHHLHAPPRGYHWVQSGSDYLLVAVATGLIAETLLNN